MKIKSQSREKDGIKYSYTLVMNDEVSTPTLHTVKIRMKSNDGSINTYAKEEIFAAQASAVAFLDKLVDNLATPINLPFVIADEEL